MTADGPADVATQLRSPALHPAHGAGCVARAMVRTTRRLWQQPLWLQPVSMLLRSIPIVCAEPRLPYRRAEHKRMLPASFLVPLIQRGLPEFAS